MTAIKERLKLYVGSLRKALGRKNGKDKSAKCKKERPVIDRG
jgi:hypothetical protein